MQEQKYHLYYYKKNKEKILASAKKWAAKNKDKIAEYGKLYNSRLEVKKSNAELAKKRRLSNPEKYREYDRQRYANGKKKKQILTAEQRAQKIKYGGKYREENKAEMKIKEKQRRCKKNERSKERRKIDPLFTMAARCRCRIRAVLRNKKISKNSKTRMYLGCDYDFLVKYLESKFTKGMAWGNMSLWQIDHIIPLASAKSESEIIKLFHYTNLQPLWERENKTKSDKITTAQPELLLTML